MQVDASAFKFTAYFCKVLFINICGSAVKKCIFCRSLQPLLLSNLKPRHGPAVAENFTRSRCLKPGLFHTLENLSVLFRKSVPSAECRKLSLRATCAIGP